MRAELDEVIRREVSFRLKTVKDFFAIEAKSRELEKSADEKNAYIHQLHVERLQLRKTIQEAYADLEAFTWMLQSSERDAESFTQLKKSAFWPIIQTLIPKQRRNATEVVPPGDFNYYLHTSPYRLYRDDHFTLRGWALPKNDAAVSAIRVRVDDKTYYGTCGLPEPEVLREHGSQPKNPQPGFTVTFDTPEGRHAFSLEAQLNHQTWFTVLAAPIWCRKNKAA